MGFLFWKKKKSVPLDVLGWNLMIGATDADKCWDLASAFRKPDVPNNVLTCETSFLMGSILRNAIRSVVLETDRKPILDSAQEAFCRTFDDQSDEDLPIEMQEVYGHARLGDIARQMSSVYAESGDELFLTCSIFVTRIKGDPRMKYDILPLFEERRRVFVQLTKRLFFG